MSVAIEVDDQTYRALELAAQMSNTTTGQVVARLFEQASSRPQAVAAPKTSPTHAVAVHADYEGHRTQAEYDPATTRVDVVSGPLRGRSFKTPSSAARAIVGHYKPTVNPNRNGWTFWILDDGSDRPLRSLR